MPKRSLTAQIDEVTYEIEMCRRVYPAQAARRAMKAEEAKYRIANIPEPALATLEWLLKNETRIKNALGEGAQHDTLE